MQIGIGGAFAPLLGYAKRVAEAKTEVRVDRILRRGRIHTEKLLLRDQKELEDLRTALTIRSRRPSTTTATSSTLSAGKKTDSSLVDS